MKKYRKLVIVLFTIFLVVAIGISLFIAYMLYARWKSWEGTFVYYDANLSSNENYMGYVVGLDGELSGKVTIIDHTGKEVSHLILNDDYPSEIALGDHSYFLLYRWENEGNDARIVQYDYQSNKIKECIVPNIDTISYRDGYLFMGEPEPEEEDDDDPFWVWLYQYHGFYAHRYIAEDEFGARPEKLTADDKGRCIVGNVEMYYHEQGYFFSEPLLNDYPGTSKGQFGLDDQEDNYHAATKQELRNRELLLNAIGDKKGIWGSVFCICEYQSDENVYGVCNVLDTYIPSRPLNPEDVIKSYYYKIDPMKDEITILAQTDSCIAIIASEEVVVFQKGDQIIQKSVNSGEEKVIHTIENTRSAEVYVQGDYLLVQEKNNNCVPVKWSMISEQSS